jgi:hypothetical protein
MESYLGLLKIMISVFVKETRVARIKCEISGYLTVKFFKKNKIVSKYIKIKKIILI